MDNTQNQNPPVSPPPQLPPESIPYDTFPEEEESSPVKKILLIVGAIVGLCVIVFLIIFVVIPLFKPKEKQNVTLTWWGLWEDASVYQPLLDKFHKENPNIQVKYIKKDIKLGRYIDKLRTQIDNGNGPDILRFHNSWLIELNGFLQAFPSGVVSSTGLDKNYFPVVTQDLSKSGAYYGIPLQVDCLSLFVNNTFFKTEHIPTSWDEFQNTAIHLTVTENGQIIQSRASIGTYDNIAHAPDLISVLLAQNGADFRKLTGPQRKNAKDALDFYTHFAKGEDQIWNNDLENSKLAFAKGKVAMYFGYSWDLLDIRALNPNLDFSILPVPILPPKRNTTIASYWVEGVSSKTKHQDEAFQFLKFMSKKENLEQLHTLQAQSRGLATPYPRSDMTESLRSDKYLYPFMIGMQNAVGTPFSSDTYDDGFNTSVNSYLGNAIRSILNDSTSVDTALDKLADGMNSIYSKYGAQ